MVKPRLTYCERHFVNDPDKQTCENRESSSLTGDWAGYAAITHFEDSEITTEMSVTEPGGYVLEVR